MTQTTIEVMEQGGDATGGKTFRITVREGGSQSQHTVTMDQNTYRKIAPDGQHDASRVIKASFAFLLDREPKEMILGRFDLPLIANYFPEYYSKLPDYLARA